MEGIDQDDDQLMRDPYVHFNYLHRPEHRRYTILEGGFVSNYQRRGHEYLFALKHGGFVYNPENFTGALNHV